MARRLPSQKPPQRNAVGLLLRQFREAKGWSQTELARELQLVGWSVERTVITKIELRLRCITDYELLLLVRVLGVSLAKLDQTPIRALVGLTGPNV